MENTVDWDHTYLLGWYGSDGRAYLSSWHGEAPRVDVVVITSSSYGPPLWNAPIQEGTLAFPIPEHVQGHDEKIAYAREHGGVYAFGWYLDQVIDRTPKKK